MSSQKPCFRFEIDNFSERKDKIVSQIFVSGGCEWCLWVYPKGEGLCNDHLSLFLSVANPLLLQLGWKKSVNYHFSLLNQSDKKLYRSPIGCGPFSPKDYTWGYRRLLPLSKFHEKGFLEEDKLIIEVYIKIVDGEFVDINGFQVLTSQVTSVRKIFKEHPDLAKDLKPKSQVVKTEYMNVILGLVNTLDKPVKNISANELRNVDSELDELTDEGFNLDWLITKFDMAYWEKMKSYDANGVRVQGLEERVKNLEQMESNLKNKLEEIELERKKAKDHDELRVEKLEERVKNIEMMDSLMSKLEDVFLEKKKPYDADGSRVQELEESVKDLKIMVSDLKAKLDKDEAKSSDDEFLLVNEVA